MKLKMGHLFVPDFVFKLLPILLPPFPVFCPGPFLLGPSFLALHRLLVALLAIPLVELWRDERCDSLLRQGPLSPPTKLSLAPGFHRVAAGTNHSVCSRPEPQLCQPPAFIAKKLLAIASHLPHGLYALEVIVCGGHV